MKEYILLNKDKIVGNFKWTSIMVTVAFCIWLYYRCNKDNCYNTIEIVYGLLITLLIVPSYLLVIGIVQGFIEVKKTDKFFNSQPINELFKNGFKKDWTNKNSRWFFSKLCAVGQFDKYEMICEVENKRLRIIAKANYDHLDDWSVNEIKSVIQSFKEINFEYDGEGIATSLEKSKVKKMTYADLINYLTDFGKMLEKLKIG